ncbi:MAG: hypothetical protein MJY69_00725 [Bacteroidales bacterium]|nr:hypothetical protein [Bacteroidales bacterium]
MGKDKIKTETTAEQYVAEVIGPKIEAIEEYLDSLKENQTVILNAIKEDNANLSSKFEEMRTAKAQGRQFVYCNKENVDASIKESINTLLDDNLVQRKIKVETSATAHISEADVKMIKDQANAFREWMKANKTRQEAYEKSRHPFIRIKFGKPWYLWTLIVISAFSLFSIGYVHYNIHQTPECWADRSYKAGLELDEDNPGTAYHETIQDFKNGYSIEARQKVSDRELAGKERTKEKHRYEKKLNKYLTDVDSLGVTVTNYIQAVNRDGETESLVFFRDDVDEYAAFIFPDGTIGITLDKSICSMEKAKASLQKKIWLWQGNISEPLVVQ